MGNDLVVALKITADNGGFVGPIRASADEIRKLGQAADQADAAALRAAAGYGTVETQLRSASSAAAAYANETRMQAQAINDYGDRLDGMKAKFNPFVTLQRDYRDRQAEINEAVRLGGITELEGVRALDMSRAAYTRNLNALRQASAATREHTGAVQLQRYQIANLWQQIQDVGVGLGSGQSPITILIQQGPQITSAMGGVRNALELVKPYFNFVNISIAGTTAALVTGAAAWNSYLSSIKAVETASAGVGRGLGGALGDLEDYAKAGAAAGDISVKAAREAEVAFLRTGKIGSSVYVGLISIARDYAATIGTDLNGAIDDLAQKFADPVKGAEELQKQFGTLDDKTLQYIRTLASDNRLEEARNALYDALNSRIIDAGNNLTWLGRVANTIGVSVSDAFDRLGEGVHNLFNLPEASQKYLDSLTAARDRARKSFYGKALLEGVGILDEDELNAEISRVQAKLAQAARDTQTRTAATLSTRAGEIARNITPGYSDLKGLKEQRAVLRDQLHNPEAAAMADNLVQVATAYNALSHAIDTYITPAERARRQDELAVQALNAKTPAQKAAIAAEQKRLELAGQTVTAGQAEAQIASAGTLARRTATQAIIDQNAALSLGARASLDVADAYLKSGAAAQVAEARRIALTEALQTGADVETQTRIHLQEAIAAQAAEAARSVSDMNAQTAAQARVNDAVASGSASLADATRAAERDAALRPLLIALANAEGREKAALTRSIDELTAAYGRAAVEQARAAAASTLSGQRDELEMLDREIGLVGASARTRATSLAALQAEQQARRAGIDLASVEGQQILANARAIAERNLELERAQQIYDDFGNIASNAFDRVTDALASGKRDWADYKDIALDGLRDIQREILNLAFKAPIMNRLFGTNYATLGNAGGLIGSLLGGGGSSSLPGTFEAGFTNAVVAHTGWVVGAAANENRRVPSALFANAQRRHSGGLAADEVPIIARRKEEILTEDDPRHIFNIGKGGSRAVPSITNNVYTPAGTKTTTRSSMDEQGNLTLDTFVVQLEDAMGARAARGQGSLVTGLGQAFNANPNAGRQRRG